MGTEHTHWRVSRARSPGLFLRSHSQEAQSQVLTWLPTAGSPGVTSLFTHLLLLGSVIYFVFSCLSVFSMYGIWIWVFKYKPPQIPPGSRRYVRASVGDEAVGEARAIQWSENP